MQRILVVLALLACFVAVILTFILASGIKNPLAWIGVGLCLYMGSKLVSE